MSIELAIRRFLVPLALIPAVICAILLYHYGKNMLAEAVSRSILEACALENSTVQMYFSTSGQTMKNVATSAPVIDCLRTLDAQQTSGTKAAERALDLVRDVLSMQVMTRATLDQVALYNAKGAPVFYASQSMIPTEAQAEVLLKNPQTAARFIAPVLIDGEKYIVGCMSVYDRDQLIGTLLYFANAKLVDNFLVKLDRQNFGYMTLMDETGNIIGSTSPDYLPQHFNLHDVPGNDGLFDIIYCNNDSLSLSIASEGYRKINYETNGIERVGCFARVPGINWVVLHSIAYDDMMAPVSSMMHQIVWVIIICLIPVLMVASILSRVLCRPFHQLIQTIVALERGDEDVAFQRQKTDEFIEIAKIFNYILHQLQGKTRRLVGQEARFRALIDASTDIVFEYDYVKEEFSEDGQKIFEKIGYRRMRTMTDFVTSDISDNENCMLILNTFIRAFESRCMEECIFSIFNGSWYRVRVTPICSATIETPHLAVVTLNNVTQQKKWEEETLKRTQIDGLTGIRNRAAFREQCKTEFVTAQNNAKQLGFIFIDLDGFKLLNDGFGHGFGDRVLRFVADTLTQHVSRPDGFVGRVGGDEFMVCVTNQNDTSALTRTLAREIHQSLNLGISVREHPEPVAIECSIGLCIFPEHGSSIEELIAQADGAMYQAKLQGKNRVCEA